MISRIGIVSAIPEELRPLIRDWPAKEWRHGGRTFRLFESAGVVALCGGIGYEAGQRAAEAMISYAKPVLMIGAGIAGALKPEFKIASTLRPAVVIDAGTGAAFRTIAGEGSVVTCRGVADFEAKRALASKFGADLVDMEGAAIAGVAARHQVPLLLAKSVSDEVDFELPPLNAFVDRGGRFRKLRFTMHAAVHPGWWRQIALLKRNTERAAEALAVLLREIVAEYDEGSDLSSPSCVQ